MKLTLDSGQISAVLPSDPQVAAEQLAVHVVEPVPDQIAKWRGEIQNLIAAGNINDALKLQDQILGIEPENLEALAGKADLLATMNRYAEAISVYDMALGIDPKHPNILLRKTLALYASGRHKEALTSTKTLLRLVPENAEILRIKGDSLLALARYNQAVSTYEQVSRLQPNAFAAEDWTVRGNSLLERGRFARATQFFNRALRAQPNNVWAAWAWRGKAMAVSSFPNKRKTSLRYLSRALKSDPVNAALWIDKGTVCFRQQDYKNAVRYYGEAAKLNTGDFESRFYKAIALERQGKYTDSLQMLEEAMKLDANRADAWVEKAYCQSELGDFDGAIKSADQSLALDPGSLLAWNNKGWALYKQERWADAIKAFDNSIRVHPYDHHAWYYKARCLKELGRTRQALRCLQRSLKTVADRHAALSSLAAFYSLSLLQPREALRFYQDALKLQPRNAMTRANIAECLINLGKYREGRELARSISARAAGSLRIFCTLKFLVLVSYALSKHRILRAREFAGLIDHFAQAEATSPEERLTWDFRGLTETISHSDVDPETKFLLLSLIDLQAGKIRRSDLTFFSQNIYDKTGVVKSRAACAHA